MKELRAACRSRAGFVPIWDESRKNQLLTITNKNDRYSRSSTEIPLGSHFLPATTFNVKGGLKRCKLTAPNYFVVLLCA